jgi:glycosyltransferase involved in cell wall biosynthesis
VRPLVVLPTYQEAATISAVVRRVRSALPAASVLVVDDASPDGTADLVDGLAAELGQVAVLRRPAKAGLGSAYREGFAWGLARGFDAFVEMDADLSHDPDALPMLIDRLEEGADLVIGSRYVAGGSIPSWSWRRLALSRAGNRYAAVMLNLPVHDATSGYRVYRGSALSALDLSTIRADGYGFQIEMAYRIDRAGGKVVEVPISFVDRTMGVSKMSSRVVVEALALVTAWGLRDRLLHQFGRHRRRSVAE